MKCYYEILGVNRDANESDIKKSYRKLALQWHPDKNPNDPDKAREHFQLVQQAYEVLSDSNERAWYDKHREQILRGKNSNYEDNCLNVFEYFTVTCYQGYDDQNPNNFYQVYNEVFLKIAAEDLEFMNNEEEILKIPKFGNSESNYEQIVGPFYAFWQSYCTKRSYSWLCKYDINEIKERRILREIEKETKKIAQKAKKERNDEVRNLVLFVKKRDKRVQNYRLQLEQKAEENRRKQEQKRLEQIRQRNRDREQMKNSETNNFFTSDAYEEQLRQLEQEYTDDDEDEDEESSDLDTEEYAEDSDLYLDEENEILSCIVCQLKFDSETETINHKLTAEHLNEVEKLTLKLEREDNEYNLASTIVNDHKIDLETSNNEEEEAEEHTEEVEEHTEEEEAHFIPQKSTKKDKKKKMKKSVQAANVDSDIELESEEAVDLLANLNLEQEEWTKSSANSKKNRKTKGKKSQNSPAAAAGSKIDENLIENEIFGTESVPTNETATTSLTCATCNTKFQSKNKLFTHLKKENHGIYIPKEGTSSSGSKNAGIVNGTKPKKKNHKKK